MAITEIKYANFSEGTCACINSASGIPTEDYPTLAGKFISNISIDIPAVGNNTEKTLTDKNGATLKITIDRTAARNATIKVFLNGTQLFNSNITISSSYSSMWDLCTPARLVMGYSSSYSHYGIYFIYDYIDAYSTSWANGRFFDGVARYGSVGGFTNPTNLTDYVAYWANRRAWCYLNILNDGYCTADGVSGDYCSIGTTFLDSASLSTYILSILDDAPPTPPTDPYAGGGTSEPGGGSGTFDGSSSEIELPATVPSAGALNSGFIKVFNPSAANVTALAAYLWGTFDIQSFKSIYNNPIDCIIALLVVPVTPTVGAAATISLGNIATTVSAPVVSDQFVIFDCGSLDIREYWGAYLDYDPYTKVEIYLPYIGVRDIDVNDIQGKTVQLKYYIDVLSGTCVAMLQCGSDVLYSWSGQCAAEIPITSTGFGSAFQTALSAGNAIGETIVNAMSGIPQNISQVASSVFNGARSKVHKSGSLGSMAGHMGIQTPYLILTRPEQSVPEDLNKLTGYPSNITATLSDLEGYTEIDVIYPENIPATSAEMDEIVQLLKDGVIL